MLLQWTQVCFFYHIGAAVCVLQLCVFGPQRAMARCWSSGTVDCTVFEAPRCPFLTHFYMLQPWDILSVMFMYKLSLQKFSVLPRLTQLNGIIMQKRRLCVPKVDDPAQLRDVLV